MFCIFVKGFGTEKGGPLRNGVGHGEKGTGSQKFTSSNLYQHPAPTPNTYIKTQSCLALYPLNCRKLQLKKMTINIINKLTVLRSDFLLF